MVVTDDGKGKLDFEVHLSGATLSSLLLETGFELYIDADHDRATGGEGAEYLFAVQGPQVAALTWNGSDWVEGEGYEFVVVTFSPAGDRVTIGLTPAAVGSPRSFGFDVAVWHGEDTDQVNGLGFPATPQISRFFVPKIAVAGPKAGTTLRFPTNGVGWEFAPGSPETELTFTCELTVAGKPLKEFGGAKACAWKIPKALKGKKAVLKLTFFSGDQAILTRSFTSTVR